MDLCNINVIKVLLAKYGFRFSKSMGQNFLVESWVPERLVLEAGVNNTHGVIEIGPGIGCLTQKLAETAGKVVAIELDSKLIPVLNETLADRENVEVINGDALKINIPALIEEKLPGLTPIVCANLPYNITSPILTSLISCGRFESITVMIQKEVAKRICAKPGTADYGSFTLFVNYYTEPKILFDVSPGCFIPQPKVTSSVISMVTRKTPLVSVNDEKLLFRVIRAAFSMRRKILVNSLMSSFGNKFDKGDIADILLECGFKPLVRGEELSLDDFARLSDAIGCRL